MVIILFSAIAGIVGTGIGGLIAAAISRRSPDMICWMLSFAAGVMTSIVCFGLLPEAFESSNVPLSIVGLVLGVVTIMFLNRIVDIITQRRTGNSGNNEESSKIHQTHEELYHENLILSERRVLLRSGLLMLAAITLHNLPEGLAIGAGGTHDTQLGVLLAIMIALHNIPEGAAIAAPLLAGGMNKKKVIVLTALSGAPTLIGGTIGVLLGGISDTVVALCLAGAGGAMLYVVFGEIIPQSVVMTRSRSATIITLLGIILGLIITKL